MKKMTKILLIALGFGLFTAILGSLTSRPAPAQLPPPTVPVTVKNTTAQPVPTSAQGTTNVAGSVAISNVPTVSAQQSGAWNVGITGTPSVSLLGTPVVSLAAGGGVSVANAVNGSGKIIPLLVHDAGDNPDAYPFVFQLCVAALATAPCNNNSGVNLPLTTSDGHGVKFSVIEQINASCQVANPAIDSRFAITVGFQSNVATYFFNVPPTSYNFPQTVVNERTRIFVDSSLQSLPGPGQADISLIPGSNETCNVVLSGHMVTE